MNNPVEKDKNVDLEIKKLISGITFLEICKETANRAAEVEDFILSAKRTYPAQQEGSHI